MKSKKLRDALLKFNQNNPAMENSGDLEMITAESAISVVGGFGPVPPVKDCGTWGGECGSWGGSCGTWS
jgi:hypothetical protein